MSSRTGLRKLFKLPKSKSRKVGIEQQHRNNNNNRWLMLSEPRSMKQGRGWVSSVRNQNAATHEAQANMAAEQRIKAATIAGKNKTGRDMGSKLQNMLILEASRVSSHPAGPKLPRRKHMPLKTGETEQREFYVTLNNMPVTPAKTPVKSKQQRRFSRLTPRTPYERMDNTPSPAKSTRSRKQLTPPRFNNQAN
jgi:hypothetical protein